MGRSVPLSRPAKPMSVRYQVSIALQSWHPGLLWLEGTEYTKASKREPYSVSAKARIARQTTPTGLANGPRICWGCLPTRS